MKFGVMLVYEEVANPDFLVPLVQRCEELGFESVWSTEHVVFPATSGSSSPYVSDEEHPRDGTTPRLDPLAALSYLAAATQTIKLATSVVVLPLRNPALLAKECATIDCLSGGRHILGVGVGWLKEEFSALGVPFHERGARATEYIDALRTIWRNHEINFEGQFVQINGVLQYPKPVAASGVPIVVCGMSDAAARRAGRQGDGFFPLYKDASILPGVLATARAAAVDAGRSPDEIEITAALPEGDVDLKKLADLGVARIVVPSLGMPLTLEQVTEKLGRLSDRLFAP